MEGMERTTRPRTVAVRLSAAQCDMAEAGQALDDRLRLEAGSAPHRSQSSFIRACIRHYCEYLAAVSNPAASLDDPASS